MDVGAVKKLTEAVEAISKFAASAAGGSADKAGSSAVPGDSPATTMAGKAKESYQRTARWMLAAFAAVGVVIFGSLPFAAIADVEPTGSGLLLLVGGLLLAVAGIVGAVVAVSQVSEPEDVSLGELDRDLRTVQKVRNGEFQWDGNKRPVFTANKFQRWLDPRLAARQELAAILHGPESSAHLGPGLVDEGKRPMVRDLITKLGGLEEDHSAYAPKVAKLTVAATTHEKRAEELTKLLEELRKRHSCAPEEDKAALDQRINAASDAFSEANTALGAARQELLAEKKELARVDKELELYHAHRDLVLAESGILELRGTFRMARRILAVAAVLTLVGGTAYALSLPGSDDEDDKPAATSTAKPPPVYSAGLPALVRVHAGTKAADALDSQCVNRDLTALWVGDSPIPPRVGPFTVLITEPAACVGRVIVGRGEGTFDLVR